MPPERQQVEPWAVGRRAMGRRQRIHLGGALLLIVALTVAGCAGPLQHAIQAAPPQVAAAAPVAPTARADLDSLMYASGPPPAAGVVAPVAVASGAEPSVYLLDSGDRLRVVVFGQDGLSNSYIVDAAGNITMPLIGAVAARGVSTADLARTIGARLRNGFIREPHVAIEIEAYRPFFILGEVTYPGQYPFVPNMTVETAVAIAGGFTPRAYRWEAKVARNQGGGRIAVPLTFALRPGDTITIDERWF